MADDNPTVRARQVGAELRRLREAAGYTGAEVARYLDMSPSKLSRLENGKRSIKVEDAAALLALYRVNGPTRSDLLELCRGTGETGWWQRSSPHSNGISAYSQFESKATAIANFQPQLVPGLLQTPDYMRLVFSYGDLSDEETEHRVAHRLARKSVLSKAKPPRFTALVDEAALLRVMETPSVAAEQLQYIVLMAQRPSVTLRVALLTAGHLPTSSPFVIMDFADAPSIVVLEAPTTAVYIEDRREVREYRKLLHTILRLSLSHDESVRRVAEMAEQAERTGG
ncbi:Helix-turn-helix domain-containing protein [Streptoalloteichus tenebrarius]|uniref:Helix-turn-helix domain-containing protein n=1 Tax=Streptoalloteichus tenebrarius (strain ATCC 17920 / DSM 40477 / JCM 4838 / CBS 697.72 / NBRC 16177 / NCIMB 11028 / NRRL B-12390 / A12253. 1 / ISP 5477) TaxID=1933 RepID=A0ABT1HMM2_STRSD|nr:helix-turn-helix transcriptional regulator [Streptoalloteichus tenebrarius]MCP2256734.1 Helix-turn-helix domain-containing protein [Streptoalloteichus tenebrarius]BFF00364.1 helix-turn-helix transcriptional regulator [Streptoalloteichus tenebrarius]